MRETGVVLGIDDAALLEEAHHFLDRLPTVEVRGAAMSADGLRRILHQTRPHALVAIPELLPGAGEVPTFVLAVRETSDGLRAAIRAGARGFYLWPDEREALGRELTALRPRARPRPDRNGVVVAVIGARGGAGTTFLATNLAAAMARRGEQVALVDLDPLSGDVSAALGVQPDPSSPSVLDLGPVAGELTEEHLEKVLDRHVEGFHVLVAPHAVPADAGFDPATISAAVPALRSRFAATVLHLPRVLDEATRAAIERSDEVLVVVTLDVLGIRAAKRMIDHLRSVGLGERCRLVVNRAGRGEILPKDAQGVLAIPLACVIGADRAVERAQNRGELVLGKRRHLSRRLSRLAGQLLEGRAA